MQHPDRQRHKWSMHTHWLPLRKVLQDNYAHCTTRRFSNWNCFNRAKDRSKVGAPQQLQSHNWSLKSAHTPAALYKTRSHPSRGSNSRSKNWSNPKTRPDLETPTENLVTPSCSATPIHLNKLKKPSHATEFHSATQQHLPIPHSLGYTNPQCAKFPSNHTPNYAHTNKPTHISELTKPETAWPTSIQQCAPLHTPTPANRTRHGSISHLTQRRRPAQTDMRSWPRAGESPARPKTKRPKRRVEAGWCKAGEGGIEGSRASEESRDRGITSERGIKGARDTQERRGEDGGRGGDVGWRSQSENA